MSSKTRTSGARTSFTDSFFGGHTNSVGSVKRASRKPGSEKIEMPTPMTFPEPNVNKPLPEAGWGEDAQIFNLKSDTKRDHGSKKHSHSSSKHSRSKVYERQRDRDRATSLGSTPPGALVKLLVTEESNTRQTRKLLDSAFDKLQSASKRALEAEMQKRRAEDTALMQQTQLTMDVDEARRAASRAQHEVEMYKIRLHQLELEAQEAQETIKAAQEMKDDAERSAAKARATARKFKLEVAKIAARARGKEEGYYEGLRRGRLITDAGYDYIPGDGSAYIEEVGTEGEEEHKQRHRSRDRERELSTIRTPFGTQSQLSGRTESNPARHYPRYEHDRNYRRDEDHRRDREHERDHHQRGHSREPSHERRRYRAGEYSSPPETPRRDYYAHDRRPVQEPPVDIPEGVPVSMPVPSPAAHIPTPPQTTFPSRHSSHPLSPPLSSPHTARQEQAPPQTQVPTVNHVNNPVGSTSPNDVVPLAANAPVPPRPPPIPVASPPSQPPAVPQSPASQAPSQASSVPLAPGLYGDSRSIHLSPGIYPAVPPPDGVSPLPRINIPLGSGFHIDAAQNAPLSAGGVPFAPGLYRGPDGELAQPQPVMQPVAQSAPLPPGIPRSSPDSETPSTMTGISSINYLKNFPMRVPTAEGSVSGSERGIPGVAGSSGTRSGSRAGIRPGGTFGFERELSTIHEHSREGTPSGGEGVNLEHRSRAVDQWRRSLGDDPNNHLRPPSTGSARAYSGGDLRRKQSSTTTGSSSIQIQVQSPSPVPSPSGSYSSIHTARNGAQGHYYPNDLQPQQPGYLSPHHAPKHLISPDPEPDEPPVIPVERPETFPRKSAMRKSVPKIYENLPNGFVANGHGYANGYGYVDPRVGALGKGVQNMHLADPYYSRDKVRRRSFEYSESEEDDEDEDEDEDSADGAWLPAPPGAVTGGMPINVPLAPGIGPNYHPTPTGLNLMSFPVVAANGSLESSGRGSGDSRGGSVSGTPRMYAMNLNGMPPGFSRPATTASGKSSRRNSLKAPIYDVYSGVGHGQSMMKQPNMQMPNGAVPQYGQIQPTPGQSTITPAVHSIPEPTVPHYSTGQSSQHGSSITPAAAAMPRPEVPQYPQSGPVLQGSSITAAALSMPHASVPHYASPPVASGQQGSAITQASMTMPNLGVPQFSQPSFPEPTVPQYGTGRQASTVSDPRAPYGGSGTSRITAPAMSMPAPSSTVTAPQMSMPTPGSEDNSVQFPTPNVVDYTRGATGRPSTMTTPQMSMPTPGSGDDSVQFPTPNVVDYTKGTPAMRPSSTAPGLVNMPSPSIPQYPQTPGGSAITPAQIPFPEPSPRIGASVPMPDHGNSVITAPQIPFPEPSSSITAPQTEMPHPTSTLTGGTVSMPSPNVQYTPGGGLAHNPLPLPPRMTPSMSATLHLNPSSPVIPGADPWNATGTPNLSRRSSLHAGTTPSMGPQPLPVATGNSKKKKKKKGKQAKAALGPVDSDDDEDPDQITMRNTLVNASTLTARAPSIYS
ncbi:hypothetical protein VKT23_004589 [Stygiomarasmius scandens]|uniref:Uncharacterized protein n=1 Tax=Marasmiellus scandens TaxID=2682957 RepID=A0ABR1JVC5_9AGAR